VNVQSNAWSSLGFIYELVAVCLPLVRWFLKAEDCFIDLMFRQQRGGVVICWYDDLRLGLMRRVLLMGRFE